MRSMTWPGPEIIIAFYSHNSKLDNEQNLRELGLMYPSLASDLLYS